MISEISPENKVSRAARSGFFGNPNYPCCTGKDSSIRHKSKWRRKLISQGQSINDYSVRHTLGWERKKSLRDHRGPAGMRKKPGAETNPFPCCRKDEFYSREDRITTRTDT